MNEPSLETMLVDNPLAPTLFHEPWWLKIATNSAYEEVEIKENGRTIGRLPYFLRRKLGLPMHVMPPLTHFLGPAVNEGTGSYNKRLSKKLNITRELIRKLPHSNILRIKCHRGITDTIAFQQEGFNSSVQYTFELPPQHEDIVWRNFCAPRRTVIRSAKKKGGFVQESCDPNLFISFYKKNLTAQKKTSFFDLERAQALIAATLQKERGRLLLAYDQTKNLQGGVFYAWDQKVAYYLMTSRTHDSHNGVISLLIWEAMRDAMARNLIFDLDGLFNSGSVRLLAGFGAIVQPRYIVTRLPLLLRPIWEIQENFREGRCYN